MKTADKLPTYPDHYHYPVIKPSDVEAGDVLAVTNPRFPYWFLQEQVALRDGELWVDEHRVMGLAGKTVLRLVMRPEPLPTAPQTVIRCTYRDETCRAIRAEHSWLVVTPYGSAVTVLLREEHLITDWEIEVDPTAVAPTSSED